MFYLPGAGELSIFCVALAGGCMGFLWYNAHPAEVFMGDTGSLAIGGVLGAVAIMLKAEFLLAIVGAVFVAEALSVATQTIYYKWTKSRTGVGRRIFRMAPLHHHFEQIGWHESKVIIRFWIMGIICAMAALRHARRSADPMSVSLAGETIGVLGLARSGLAAARLAAGPRRARLRERRRRDSETRRAAAETVRGAGRRRGDGRPRPGQAGGVRRASSCPPASRPRRRCSRSPRSRRVPVIPEIEFAYEQLDCPVIGITGTNGKTTVTALIEHLMRAADIDAVAGGNIGTALSELALREPQPAWAVVECSSFQLAGIRRFTPRIGVLTNLAPDHLDWYADVEAYYADKARLFTNASPDSSGC